MITLENYESYLFLYQEGELDSSTRTEVERFLLQHPDIREEMEQYYDPTFIVTAEPPTRKRHTVTSFWRWATAACVLLALGYGAYMLYPNSTDNGTLLAEVRPTKMVNTKRPQPIAHIPNDTPSLHHKTRHNAPAHTTIPPISADSAAPTNTVIEPEPTIVHPEINPSPQTEKAKPTTPEYILTDRLALEPILVDNLAVEVPNSFPYPSSQTNLAGMLMAFSDRKKQELFDFLHREQHPQHKTIQLAQEIY
jgi:hypothetical protein